MSLVPAMSLGGAAVNNACSTCGAFSEIETTHADDIDYDALNALARTGEVSQFERVLTIHPPIFDTLLFHLPTRSIISLYHCSHRLRQFFQLYPLAWKNLSFRQPSADLQSQQTTLTADNWVLPNLHSVDFLLRSILHYGTRLARLDLDNSNASGSELYARVLTNCRGTLVHLSVRNCKHVSLKYHVLPYLQLELAAPDTLSGNVPFALKSLYTWQCRHHRKRPYLRSSLGKRDSDSQPTHQIVSACHLLNVWTDTGWCTTPSTRCLRRKEYAYGRVPPDSNLEIWVPFDRLWRSQNIIGAYPPTEPPVTDEVAEIKQSYGERLSPDVRYTDKSKGSFCAWKQELGHLGEALGSGLSATDDGKEVPAHERQSHTLFIDGFACHACGEKIYERCEICSLRMHCVGCRKTLCASCAFDRPLPWKKRKIKHPASRSEPMDRDNSSMVGLPLQPREDSQENGQDNQAPYKFRLWWAPGCDRSPNIVNENIDDEEHSSEDDTGVDENGQIIRLPDPRISTKLCCKRMDFFDSYRSDVRAVPLPLGQGFEDPAFPKIVDTSTAPEIGDLRPVDADADGYPNTLTPQDPPPPTLRNDSTRAWDKPQRRTRKVAPFDLDKLLRFLITKTSPTKGSPRNLCLPCYQSSNWNARCAIKECQNLLCIEHDVNSLRVRQCGSRRLTLELKRLLLDGVPDQSNRDREQDVRRAFLAKWKPAADEMRKQNFDRDSTRLFNGFEPTRPIVYNGSINRSGEDCSKQSSTMSRAGRPDGQHKSSIFRSSSASRVRSCSEPPTNSDFQQTYDDASIQAVSHQPPSLEDLSYVSEGGRLFSGCRRLFCLVPSERPASDIRSNCAGWEYVHTCVSCGVIACYDCCGMEMGCSCSMCTSDSSKFKCPACFGDWHIARKVAMKITSLAEKSQPWPKEARSERFWRCRAEEETKLFNDLTAEWRQKEMEESNKAAFNELPTMEAFIPT